MQKQMELSRKRPLSVHYECGVPPGGADGGYSGLFTPAPSL